MILPTSVTKVDSRRRQVAALDSIVLEIALGERSPFETVVHQNGQGFYAKAEYSRAFGQHWRVTAGLALLRGAPDDFLGQYRLNSHAILTLRYSFRLT